MHIVDFMNQKKSFTNLAFQSLYVSKECSNCPLIPDVINFIKGLGSINNLTISHRFGRRTLINSNNTILKKIGKENFLEIVDYDPFKKILMVMGVKEVVNDTPLHWYIHHARDDVNVVLLIKDKKIDKIPIIDNKYPIWTIEQIKEVLGALRNNKIVNIKDVGVLLVGNSLKDTENLYSKFRGKLK